MSHAWSDGQIASASSATCRRRPRRRRARQRRVRSGPPRAQASGLPRRGARGRRCARARKSRARRSKARAARDPPIEAPPALACVQTRTAMGEPGSASPRPEGAPRRPGAALLLPRARRVARGSASATPTGGRERSDSRLPACFKVMSSRTGSPLAPSFAAREWSIIFRRRGFDWLKLASYRLIGGTHFGARGAEPPGNVGFADALGADRLCTHRGDA